METKSALRSEIITQLKNVSALNAPNVYERIMTQSGFEEIEQKIIRMVVFDKITPSACIPHIENELS